MERISLELCSFKDEKVALDWKKIYEENTDLPHFASYEFNLRFVKSFKKNRHRKNMRLMLVRAFDENDDTLMFLPLCKDRDEYYLMWDYSSVMYCEPIYRSDVTSDVFDKILNKLSDVLGSETLFFTKMNDMSPFTEYLRLRHTPYRKHTCVCVNAVSPYEIFYMDMPEEGRLLIEEGRRAVKARKASFCTYFYCGRPIPKNLYEKLYSIYYGSDPTLFQRIRNYFYDNNNPVSCSLRKGEESIIAVSCINGEPVAFVGGFVRNGRYTMVRHGESRRYSDCNAFNILLSDTVKYCVEKKGIRTIDFGQGREEYKFAMGGDPHYLYYFEVKL